MALGLTLVTVTVLHQQAADLFAVPDRGDPLFSMWRMAWVRHQLFVNPRHLFDANIFYPLSATLTYSDSMILPALASAPLAWAHVHPVVAYNLVLLASFVLSGLSAYWLARGLGSGTLAAWITAVAFTIAPFRMNHFSHLELQMTMWMPMVLLSIERVLRAGSKGYAMLLTFSLAAQWYSSMYYGVFLTLYGAAFGTVLAIAARVPRGIVYGLAAVCVAGLSSLRSLTHTCGRPRRAACGRRTLCRHSAPCRRTTCGQARGIRSIARFCLGSFTRSGRCFPAWFRLSLHSLAPGRRSPFLASRSWSPVPWPSMDRWACTGCCIRSFTSG